MEVGGGKSAREHRKGDRKKGGSDARAGMHICRTADRYVVQRGMKTKKKMCRSMMLQQTWNDAAARRYVEDGVGDVGRWMRKQH